MTAHELNVNITDFDPAALLVRAVDVDGTGYVMHLGVQDCDRLLAELTDRGRCPRCDFEHALADVVYAGEFIRDHYAPGEPGTLSPTEATILGECRSWLTDDAIERCLEDGQ